MRITDKGIDRMIALLNVARQTRNVFFTKKNGALYAIYKKTPKGVTPLVGGLKPRECYYVIEGILIGSNGEEK